MSKCKTMSTLSGARSSAKSVNVVTRLILLLSLVAASFFPCLTADAKDDKSSHKANEAKARNEHRADDSDENADSDEDGIYGPWFLIFGMVNSYPRLESEELIDRIYTPIMNVIAPGIDEVYTVSDLRDDYMIWPPHIGFGRVLSDKWSIFFQCGYSAGKVRSEADKVSIFWLPLFTDFEIKRGAAYAGLGLDYFPMGQVELRKYDGWLERLRSAKPTIGLRHTWTYATYTAKVKVGFAPFDNIVSYEQTDSWLIGNIGGNVGVDIPVSKRDILLFNAGYNFFFDRDFDFNGAAYTVGWKRFF